MSSSINRRYLSRQRSAVHPLLAICVPFAFLLCLDTVLRDAFPSLGFPSRLILPALLCVGIEVTAIGNLLQDERAGFFARLRELLAVTVLAYAIMAVIASVKAQALVLADLSFIYPVLMIFAQWIFSAGIHAHLRDREILLAFLLGKKGEVMLHTLRDASLQAGSSLRGLRRLAALVIFFQVVIFVLLAATLLNGRRIGAASVVLCGLHGAFGLLALGIVNTFSHDQLLLGEGVVVSGRLQAGRLATALAFIALGVPLAVLVSRDASPLSLSLLAGLLGRLAALFPARPIQDTLNSYRSLLEMQLAYQRQLSSIPVVPINPMVFVLADVFRRMVITAVGAGLYFFLISPLLSAEFLESFSRHGLPAFLLRKLRALLTFFGRAALRIAIILRSLFRTRRAAGGEASPSKREWIRTTPEPGVSMRKRIQAGRMVKAFLLLLRWGETRGVEFRAFETVMEYARRLLPIVPDKESQVSLVAEILEEALFSTHILERRRVGQYFSALREIRKIAA